MSYDSGADDSEGSLRDFIASEDEEEDPGALFMPPTDDDDNGDDDDAEIIGQELEVEGTKVDDSGRRRSTRSRRAPQRYVESKEYLDDLAEACSKSRAYADLSDMSDDDDDADIDDEEDSDFELAVDRESDDDEESDADE